MDWMGMEGKDTGRSRATGLPLTLRNSSMILLLHAAILRHSISSLVEPGFPRSTSNRGS